MEVVLPAVRKTIGAAPGLFSTIGRTILPRDWVYKIAARVEFQESLLSRQDFMPYLRGLAHLDPSLFLGMLDEANRHSCRDLLPQIRVPTLVIAGELDTFTPAELSREMAEKIPGAELLIVPGGTHTAPLEHPNLVGSVIGDFLARLPTTL
jgi:pimeloyl-ACP methyl ester carboxylesterase